MGSEQGNTKTGCKTDVNIMNFLAQEESKILEQYY